MADFKTHITTSSALGIGIGAAAHFGMDFPLEQAILGAGLCSIAGMLPDLDSPNSVPIRETINFGSAFVPMLLLPRFREMGLSPEQIILFGGLLYFGLRFGVGEIFKRYTVHRGMWHSVPAALIASLLALWICSCDYLPHRLFKSGSVFIGFVSHLVLDEIYSIDLSGKQIRVKKSLGTALKFWSGNSYANFSCYMKLGAVLFVLLFDPSIMNAVGQKPLEVPVAAREFLMRVTNQVQRENDSESDDPHAGHNHGGGGEDDRLRIDAQDPSSKSKTLSDRSDDLDLLR